MKRYAIIAAGGSGTRAGLDIPKQFIVVAGKPILGYTLDTFVEQGVQIILSLPESWIAYWKEILTENSLEYNTQIVTGGATRFHSIKNALAEIKEDGIVAVHDAARPLASTLLIQNLYQSAEKHGNSIPIIPIKSSMRQLTDTGSVALERSNYVEVQTPQCFSVSLLKRAYKQQYDDKFTDDASLIEELGEKIYQIPGESTNFKITTKEDIVLFEQLI